MLSLRLHVFLLDRWPLTLGLALVLVLTLALALTLALVGWNDEFAPAAHPAPGDLPRSHEGGEGSRARDLGLRGQGSGVRGLVG